MKKLSVLIPTYNRGDRLRKSLASYTQEKIKNIEFVVIDNYSKDDTEVIVRSLIAKDNRIKYYKNPTNLGYNRNLFRVFLEAEAEWLCILPDDDAVELGFLSELIEKIDQNNDCSIILTAQKYGKDSFQKIINQSTKFEKGNEAFKIAFKGSGTVLGYTFNKTKIDQKDWLLDNSIYPQIRIATEASLKYSLLYLIPKNYPIIGAYDSINTVINNDMGRPIDFGVIERLQILIDVSKKITKQQRSSIRHTLSAGLFLWAIGIAKLIYVKNKEHTLKYIKSLLKHKFIKSSSIFLGLLILKLVFNNQITLIHRIKILGYVVGSILTSLLNMNFYSSFIFGLKNINKINNIE